MTAPWSLQRRLTLWIAGSVGGLFLLVVGFTAWFVNDALQRELDGLVEEELAEFALECVAVELTRQQFAEFGRDLEARHPGVELGWRAWVAGEAEPWAIVGTPPSLDFPARDVAGDEVTVQLEGGARWRRKTIEATIATGDGPRTVPFIVELLLDGKPRERDLRHISILFLSMALIGSLLASLGGAVLAKRIADMLRQVAHSAEAARLDRVADSRPLPNAPEEIRHVAEAFRRSVADMRAEHSRNLLLTAGLAHELRSPMQNMITEAEVALLRERGIGEYKSVIASQLDEIQELAHVVDNLITLTALRDTGQLPRHERFDMGAEVQLRMSKERALAARRGVVIQLSTRGDLWIDGDREALLLMLRNLVGNAIQWTPASSTVKVDIDGRESDLTILVQDQGRGVAVSERESIFDAFYKRESPEGGRMGYGLGLALARAAVTSHGGEIRLGESDGGGARFEVVLRRGPRKENQAAGRPAARNSSSNVAAARE